MAMLALFWIAGFGLLCVGYVGLRTAPSTITSGDSLSGSFTEQIGHGTTRSAGEKFEHKAWAISALDALFGALVSKLPRLRYARLVSRRFLLVSIARHRS